MSDPPEVFVSYTHDSEGHKQAVVGLVSDLRRNGIDARIDREINGTPEKGSSLGCPARSLGFRKNKEFQGQCFAIGACLRDYSHCRHATRGRIAVQIDV